MAFAQPRVATDRVSRRARRTTDGFGDLRSAADEIVASHTHAESLHLAKQLFALDVHQTRMIATFIVGMCAAQSREALRFLRERVSRDADWRLQEILAHAFDRYCADVEYERALPTRCKLIA